MVFNNIVVVESEKTTVEHIQNREALKEVLDNLKKNYTWIQFPDINCNSFKEKDLVIALGGDGVFVRASHYLRETPILGINSDPKTSEGALDKFKGVNKESIKKVLSGEYEIKEWTRGRVLRNGQLLKELVINEVYIGMKSQFHTSRYIIEFNEQKEEQRSSGVVISTGSGSAAWYKSAGGDPFSCEEKKMKFLVREIYEANLFKPKIRNGVIQGEEKIILESKRRDGGVITIDCVVTYPFNLGDKVEVRICKQNLKVIVPKG